MQIKGTHSLTELYQTATYVGVELTHHRQATLGRLSFCSDQNVARQTWRWSQRMYHGVFPSEKNTLRQYKAMETLARFYLLENQR